MRSFPALQTSRTAPAQSTRIFLAAFVTRSFARTWQHFFEPPGIQLSQGQRAFAGVRPTFVGTIDEQRENQHSHLRMTRPEGRYVEYNEVRLSSRPQ